MAKWQAKKFQLPNHNFETTAIKFEDGRVGLCYHGSVIWDDESGGWEAFIATDWGTVWKEGKPCSFKELPPEMRIACPACGGKLSPADKECAKCGVVFEKMKEEPAPTEPAVSAVQETEGKPRSRILDAGLAAGALLIAGLFVFYALKPEPPQTAAPSTAPTEEQAVTVRSEPAVSRPERARDQAPVQTEATEAESPSEAPASVPESSPVPAPEEQFYSHINLDDPEKARAQLEEESKRLNEEAVRIQQALVDAGTPEEKQRAREDKSRYDQKAIQLSDLIREYNARK